MGNFLSWRPPEGYKCQHRQLSGWGLHFQLVLLKKKKRERDLEKVRSKEIYNPNCQKPFWNFQITLLPIQTKQSPFFWSEATDNILLHSVSAKAHFLAPLSKKDFPAFVNSSTCVHFACYDQPLCFDWLFFTGRNIFTHSIYSLLFLGRTCFKISLEQALFMNVMVIM